MSSVHANNGGREVHYCTSIQIAMETRFSNTVKQNRGGDVAIRPRSAKSMNISPTLMFSQAVGY